MHGIIGILEIPFPFNPMHPINPSSDIQFTLDTIASAADTFWQHAGDRKIFGFHGPLGAGKTTFIKYLCQAKGVTSPVSSPTFSIINQYQAGAKSLYHIDLYRLKDEDEALRAGVEDCLYSGNICLVEWPERAPGLFPENTVSVYFAAVDPKTRIISIVY
jgi:tRNA threonylcarbamoyladenosine biosynthesis protein TsaE